MIIQVFSPATIATLLLIVISFFIIRRLRSSLLPKAGTGKLPLPIATLTAKEPSKINKILTSALPNSVISPNDASTFAKSMDSYWAQQECEVIPECVVRPRNIQELSVAVKILKEEFDFRQRNEARVIGGLFAVRSGGHSPVSGAASIKGGVLIDVGLFREVTPSEDGSSVVIGAGAKWAEVSQVLDSRGLAVAGGRNSAVGVGGFVLGGGLSFFSPQFGLACSNIIEYEIVLADGSIATASSSTHPDLWRALKGGSNNYGIVTRFTAHSFPSSKIWAGFIYLLPSQTNNVLKAFHEFVSRTDSNEQTTMYDKYAAGPIASFSYVHQLGFQLLAVHLVHTNSAKPENQWPECWSTSSFKNLWRIWSTCKTRSLTSATDELNALNPSGRRQMFATTTIKNDLPTLHAVHAIYHDALKPLRRCNVKGLVWSFILQPLLPEWVRKGDSNPLGLHDLVDEPLVLVSFSVNWDESQDDMLVKTTTRDAIERMEAIATEMKTAHRWRYLNYCAEWQKPFEGYGEENLRFLQDVSRKYDPEGLFQKGCAGGFKLDI